MTDRKVCWIVWWTAIAALTMALAEPVWADATEPEWVSKIVSLQGEVLVKRVGQGDWRPALLNDFFFAGDTLHVAADSRAALVLSNETVLRVDQLTTLVFKGIQEPKSFWMELLEGAAFFFSRKPRSLTVSTPFVNGVVEGTEFYVRVDRDRTQIVLYEGAVRAENENGALLLAKGQAAVAEAGRPPRLETVVRPRDAVQWALYYPPSLVFGADDFPASGAADWRADARRSAQALAEGRMADAFAAIEAIDPAAAAPRFSVYRAHLRLMVGQVGGAREDIERVLALAPRDSDALALRTIVAVVQNRKEEALADGRAAVEANPGSAAAHIALSYAMQARFDLPAAAAEAQAATVAEPENPLAWARLAELRLCLGDLEAALAAAQKSAALPPSLAHTQNVLGYAYLAQIKTEKAQEAFHQAIVLDSAAPLPRLGLGLAQIREGRLAEGRAEIEIAAALDPDNALIRSYLGKAYLDEKRGDLDERQLSMAKNLDPNDPTPWFYDAIREQTLNRPGEALEDMQQAIERNDHRAVYRSRLMLDDDLASRSAALGRIYSDLSFQELAINQGHQSLNTDPANYSAHRLLADMYASRPRHEIARVSELLQSQLLQPLNLTPVPPQLGESNPLTLESVGPSAAGLSEFNPLFARNRTALQASGTVAENDTLADDLTLSGVQQWFSYSLGQFHYESDGFRPNNDIDRDIYNIFGQAALSPKLSLQTEYRYQETDAGDLRLMFDPETYFPEQRNEERSQSVRLGLKYSPAPAHTFLTSLIYGHTESQLTNRLSFDDPVMQFVNETRMTADTDMATAEVQYLFRSDAQNIIVGAGYLNQNRADESSMTDTITIPPFPPEIQVTTDSVDLDGNNSNGYMYYYLKAIRNLTLTLAGSYDDYKDEIVEEERFCPKAGLVWSLNPALTLRAAWFRTLKRPYLADQTLEPTQIAGFNQFFDDTDGSRTERYGVGLDSKILKNLYGGLEISWREVDKPLYDQNEGITISENEDERSHTVYLHYLVTERLAFSAQGYYEKIERPITAPNEVTTYRVPLTIGYFHPQGWFGKIITTYINQKVTNIPYEERDDFWTVDAALGYRLPRRWGVISLGARNLFDRSFHYQDENFNSGEAIIPLVQPERLIYCRFTLAL
jgi:ferric-dicitrate binding protein FerR (iron transport regulator)